MLTGHAGDVIIRTAVLVLAFHASRTRELLGVRFERRIEALIARHSEVEEIVVPDRARLGRTLTIRPAGGA
jgi:hypothetical protein